MNMPGFTAETSLYRSKTNYNMVGAHGALPRAGAVVPQNQLACGDCSGSLLGVKGCCAFNCNTKLGLCGCIGNSANVPCGDLIDWVGDIFG
jgi:hypothetical protein